MITVFINKVLVTSKLSVSIQNRFVPELSSCTITVIDSGGTYIKGDVRGDMEMVEQEIFIELEQAANNRDIIIDHSVPIFKDNDVVSIFEQRNGEYWWLFYGFVTTVAFGDFISGKKTITLSCESSLKSLRYSYIVMNSFMMPQEFSEDTLKNEIKKVFSSFQSIDVSGQTYWDKIKTLFTPELETDEDVGVFRKGEGNFKVQIKELQTPADIWNYMENIKEKSNTKLTDLTNLNQYVSNDDSERNLFILKIGDMTELMDTLFASYSISPPVFTAKIAILQNIIQGLGLVAYTLPNGDVVVEPTMHGIIGGDAWIATKDIFTSSYSFAGSNIKNTALTIYFPNIFGRTGQQVKAEHGTFRTSMVTLDKDSVKAYGLRLMNIDEMTLFPRSLEAAELYGKYLLARSWSNAKTSNVTSKHKGRGTLNRPIYVQNLDAWFLITSFSLTFSITGRKEENFNLGFGLMWNGKNWGVDVLQAYSHLSLLFDMGNLLKEDKVTTSKILILDKLSDIMKHGKNSPLKHNPSAYFLQEDII